MKLVHLVPCGTILLALSCAHLYAQAENTSPPSVILSMASDNEVVRTETQLGMRDLLMAWDEMARLHFRTAVSADPTSPMAWCGLMLTEGVTPEARAALEQILEGGVALTPQESALLSIFLKLVQGDRSGAGEEFARRAEVYRADVLSQCWAVFLLHDGYERVGSRWHAMRTQKRAQDMAWKLYQQRGLDAIAEKGRVWSLQDELASYMLAWVNESAPLPNDHAMWASKELSTMMPEHPSVHLLLGHHFFKLRQFSEAISCFRQASKLAEQARKNVPHGTLEQGDGKEYPVEMCPLELRAKLYLSTVLWLDGQRRESLWLQSELLRYTRNIQTELASAPGAVLLRWEAASLPLRLLMLDKKLPSDAQVAAASKAAVPAVTESNDPLLDVRDCLRFCLVARQRAATGKGTQARRCIEAAEASFKRLTEARSRCEGQGAYVLSAWTRAHEACQQAIFAARAAAFPDTSEIWLNSLEDASRPASMLMPPVLPR